MIGTKLADTKSQQHLGLAGTGGVYQATDIKLGLSRGVSKYRVAVLAVRCVEMRVEPAGDVRRRDSLPPAYANVGAAGIGTVQLWPS
jgi:hypothetical protein